MRSHTKHTFNLSCLLQEPSDAGLIYTQRPSPGWWIEMQGGDGAQLVNKERGGREFEAFGGFDNPRCAGL